MMNRRTVRVPTEALVTRFFLRGEGRREMGGLAEPQWRWFSMESGTRELVGLDIFLR